MSSTVFKRVLRGLTASAFGYGSNVVIQLFSLPIFLRYWGVGLYGEWLVLSAIPGYFVMSDIGFGSVAGNEMTMKVAAGDQKGALETFQSTWVFVSASSVIVAGTACAAVWLLPVGLWLNLSAISHSTAATVISILLLHVVISLQGSLVVAGYRCIGMYASITFWGNVTRVIESTGLLFSVSLGAAPSLAALVYLLLRMASFVSLRYYLRRRAPWIVFGVSHANRMTVRRLAAPAVAFMGFPAGNALSIQGMVTIVGVILGPVAVVTFSAMRTVCNAAKGVIAMINHTVWPELSMAFGAHDIRLARDLYRYACQASVWLALAAALVLALGGQLLIRIWTSGKVVMDPVFFHLMLLIIVANSVWSTSLVVPSAINRHQRVALYFVLSAAGSLFLAQFLLRWLGLPGVAVSLLIIDGVMSVYTLRVSASLLQERPSDLLRSLFHVPSFWRLMQGMRP